MRVLVTGATGFLGSRCMRVLADQGFSPIGTGRQTARAPAGFEFVGADLSRSETLGALPKVAAVVHCAARSSPWGRDEEFVRDNVQATANLLQWAEKTGVTRFVHISTPALYFAFRDQFDVGEDAPQDRPINLYAKTKAQSEQLVQASPLSTLILRPRAIYGPGDTALLPRLERAIAAGPLPLLRDGAALTNLTHVDDVCDAIALSLKYDTNYPVLNIAGEEGVRLKSLVEKIAESRDLKLRWRALPTPLVFGAARGLEWVYRGLSLPGEPRFTQYSAGIFAFSLTLSVHRAKSELGWVPKVSIDRGVESALGMQELS